MTTGPAPMEDIAGRRKRERRVWRIGFLVSVVVHLLILLLGPGGSVPISPFSAAGPDAGDDRAAEGLEVLAMSSAPPDAAQPPPAPVLDADRPEPEVVVPDAAPEVELEPMDLPDPGVGTTTGDDAEETAEIGIPDAGGAGDAGTVDEGRSRTVPPSPRGMIMPPTNRNLRGNEIEVWVFVGSDGRVVPDSTHLQPPTSDRGFNEQLVREASQWIFNPATEEGAPVAAWFPYVISM